MKWVKRCEMYPIFPQSQDAQKQASKQILGLVGDDVREKRTDFREKLRLVSHHLLARMQTKPPEAKQFVHSCM